MKTLNNTQIKKIEEEFLTEEEVKEACLEIVKKGTEENFKEDSFKILSEIFFEYLEENYNIESLTKNRLIEIFKEEKLMETVISIGKENSNCNYYYATDKCGYGVNVSFKDYKDVSKWFKEEWCEGIVLYNML